jgi:hypothetical protein
MLERLAGFQFSDRNTLAFAVDGNHFDAEALKLDHQFLTEFTGAA